MSSKELVEAATDFEAASGVLIDSVVRMVGTRLAEAPATKGARVARAFPPGDQRRA